jgi:hypothetical protein
MAVAKLIFPVVIRPAEARLIEKAKRLDADGKPLPEKRPSRSKFMREAILAEAERRIAKAGR